MNELRLYGRQAAKVWQHNPSLVHLLGISPLLAISDSIVKAIGLGLCQLLLCLFAAGAVRSLPRIINRRMRWFGYALVLAAGASVLVLLMRLLWLPLTQQLGIYAHLIACNLALLLQLDACREANSVGGAMKDALQLGAGLLLALVLFSGCRELLLSGTLFHGWQLLLPNSQAPVGFDESGQDLWFGFVGLQPAAFIGLGLMLALLRKIGWLSQQTLLHRSELPALRARVTGGMGSSRSEVSRAEPKTGFGGLERS